MKMEITFKGGAQIIVDASEFQVIRSAMGEFRKLSWNTPDDFTRKLCYADIDEIAAIVRIYEDGDDAADDKKDEVKDVEI